MYSVSMEKGVFEVHFPALFVQKVLGSIPTPHYTLIPTPHYTLIPTPHYTLIPTPHYTLIPTLCQLQFS